MRFTDGFIPTLREDPAEAEIISHKLMVRAGLLRKVAAGVYSWLPLGLKVLRKVEQIVREEMDRAGGLELLMPALQPAELWETSGRWQAYGDEMMRLTDRHEHSFCLGPTHEELITSIAKELRSYKDLPKCLYQIQMKFRDEIRPRFGVMRSREFLMKDAYSFHADQASLDRTYEAMQSAYSLIVERCGLSFRPVKAAGGLIGGAVSEEFMVLADTGEDVVVYCPDCSYAANLDTAASKWHTAAPDEPLKERVKVHTPEKTSVEEVADSLNISSDRLVKTLIFKTGEKTVAALLPGHKGLNPVKLAGILGVGEVALYEEDDFKARPDLISGFVGPVGLSDAVIIADHSLKTMRNFVVGANVKDYHWRDANVDQDFGVDVWADLVYAEPGELCPECGTGRLEQMRGIEVGHIFQLGVKYSDKLNAKYVDDGGIERPFIMGCYGVGVSRLVAATIEQKHDDRGIIWPASLAPFDIHLLLLSKDEEVKIDADNVYEELSSGYDVIYDDRQVSAGIKFADADLIGMPMQVIIGKKWLETKSAEIKLRATGERFEVEAGDLLKWIKDRRQRD
ncbi:MAG: proline--tRNA ligase [Actinomycetota bacterium]|nr:proline--tRNA ligase [Actinomycetota bacterium]